MPSLVADVDQLGSHLGQRVVGLQQIGHQPIELRALLGDEGLEPDRFGPRPHRRFLGREAALLGPAERRGHVELGAFGLGRTDRGECFVDPPVGPLEPQSSDVVDELRRGAHGDPTSEHVVVLDRSAQAPERARGNSWFAEERAQCVGHGHRRFPTLCLLRDEHRVFDRAAQVSMLDLGTLAHASTLPVRAQPNRRRSRPVLGSAVFGSVRQMGGTTAEGSTIGPSSVSTAASRPSTAVR